MTAPSPGSETLTDLLRKCHRDELVPLANTLGVRHEAMKRGTLAAAIDGKLRRSAAHELLNLVLRRGAGPPYGEVLERVADWRKVPLPDGDHEARENALLHAVLADKWRELSPEERAERWARAAGTEPVPSSGDEALEALQELDGRRYNLVAHAELAATVLPGPFGCVPALVALAPRYDRVLPAVLEVARLRQTVRYRVTVGVVGSPSSGKDAALASVFGVATGNIDPVAGSTKEVEITRLPGAQALFLVNTPGMGDVVASVTEEARQILDHIDVYVYVVNAQGGVQAREKADHAHCVATGRPVLAVINKIDTLRPDDRERYLADARDKLGTTERDFAAVAFDPLPQLAESPIGVEVVQQWIEDRLKELGKEVDELPWKTTA